MQGLVADAHEILCDPGVANMLEKNILDGEDARLVTELLSPSRQMRPHSSARGGKAPVSPQPVEPTEGSHPQTLNGRVQVAPVAASTVGQQTATAMVSTGPSLPLAAPKLVGSERAVMLSPPDPVPMDQSTLAALQAYRNQHPGQLAPLPAGHHHHVARPAQTPSTHSHLPSSLPATVPPAEGAAAQHPPPSAAVSQHAPIQGAAPQQGVSGLQKAQAAGISNTQGASTAVQSYIQAMQQYGGGPAAYGLQSGAAQLLEGMTADLQQKLLAGSVSTPSCGDASQDHMNVTGTLQAQLRNNLQALQSQASQSSDIARLAQHKQQQAGMQNPYSNQSVQSLEGAQSLILAAPSVLPGHANRQVSTAATPSHTATANNGMQLSSSSDATLSRATAAAHQLHSAGQVATGASGRSSSAADQNGNSQDVKNYAALSAALETLSANLNEDGTLPLSTFEKIVQELSGIESLQSMLLFRPNKKKGKGGRQPAKDPRLDPNMDPRKAKRIVANRQSAARSKQKQKQHLESLQLQHDTLTIQNLLCRREMEKLEKENSGLEKDTKMLELEIQALTEHVARVDSLTMFLLNERERLRLQTRMAPYITRG